jgi:hypothetical protein
MSITSHLGNNDGAFKVVAISDIEVDLDVPALGAGNIEATELLLSDRRTVVASGVVVGVDVRSRAGRGETGRYVDPALVVVHTEGDNKVLVAVLEAEDARGAAAAHGEDLLVAAFGPGATVGVVPDSLLDDLEPGVGLGLVDAGGDLVGHGSFCGRCENLEWRAIDCVHTWLGVLVGKTGRFSGWNPSKFVPVI